MGSWGQVEYWHRLECGHTDVRKRPAPTPTVACVACVQAEGKAQELQTLLAAPVGRAVLDVEDVISLEPDQVFEIDAGRLRGALAAALTVPLEAVDVVVADVEGKLVVSSAVVFLSAADASRLASTNMKESHDD